MNINATFFVQLAVFFILSWVVAGFVWPPLRTALDQRRDKIADGLAAADKGKAELAEANKRVEAELAGVRATSQARMADAERQAAALIDAAKATAEAEKARILASAKDEAAQQIIRAKDALREQVAGLVVAGAEQILKREVNAAAHADLLTQLKTQL